MPEQLSSVAVIAASARRTESGKAMNWVPVVLGLFKLVVIGTTIFFAIKSHRDEEKKKKAENAARGQCGPAEQTVEAPEPDMEVVR